MLNKVEVRTDQGVLLTLTMQDISEGFVIEDIDGLDPVKATIVSSSFAQLDGEQYQSSKREKRNMIFKLKLEPNYMDQTVRGLRNRLYGFFMPKMNANFRFFIDGVPPVDISGRVESFDAPMFTAEPKATLSVLCFNPDFYDPTVVQVVGDTTSTTTETPVQYSGTVETGVIFKLMVDRPMSEVTVYFRPPDGTLRSLYFATPMIAGDVLEINTSPGSKAARLTRAGAASSVLYGVSPYASWISLFPGTNQLRVYADGAAVPYSIEYTNKYGGL